LAAAFDLTPSVNQGKTVQEPVFCSMGNKIIRLQDTNKKKKKKKVRRRPIGRLCSINFLIGGAVTMEAAVVGIDGKTGAG
jgi:hypothetical protein